MTVLSFDALSAAVREGRIDTVLAGFADMQGRLMGKRIQARHFLDHAHAETHCCNYLLATDLEMATPEGYAAAGWGQGYGDYLLVPDLSTLRPVPWLDGTALVLCDVRDHHHAPVPHTPRDVLRRQTARLADLGLTAMAATELEFFLFARSLDEIRRGGFRDLEPWGGYNADYNLFQTTKEEAVMRPVRNHLVAAGIPVEGSKGEAEAGQEELNLRYAEAVLAADHHSIAKHAIKEIAWANGRSASFLAKWRPDRVGSATHIHLSLWQGGTPAFFDPAAPHGLSATGQAFLAGLIAHAGEITLLLAPYVNSYKRFLPGTFAPTRCVWSVDNRTAGFRLCGADSPGIRVECRIGGADLNPYLALAGLIAAGLAGIEAALPLGPATEGDAYRADAAPEIPKTLRAAIETFRGSAMLRAAMGDGVVDHYTRAGEVEQEAFDRAVTDWEIARGFERA